MKVIGLTGGTGSGKSVVSRRLAQMGAVIVDADAISRQIVEVGKPAYEEIVAHFGQGILQEDGTIFRKKLGDIVFHDAAELTFLNQCTHTYIVAQMREEITQAKAEGTALCIVLDAPLLFEVGLDALCDQIWVVYASENVRAARVMMRDGISQESAMARIANQKIWNEYAERADLILDNSGDITQLEQQLQNAIQKIAQ